MPRKSDQRNENLLKDINIKLRVKDLFAIGTESLPENL